MDVDGLGCRLLSFPVIRDSRGNLTFVESFAHVPFAIQRIYYLYDIPGGESRAGHAHRELHQVLIAVAGSFDVIVDDGGGRRATATLRHPSVGLYIPPGIWREVEGFSSGAVCLAVASDPYAESDYLRDYETFVRFRRGEA